MPAAKGEQVVPASISTLAEVSEAYALPADAPEHERRAGAGPLDRRRRQPAHAARAGESAVALPFRHRHRRHAERLRLHGRAADASRAARLAGAATARRRLAAQAAAQADRHVANVSAIERTIARMRRGSMPTPPAVAISAAATGGRGNSRHDSAARRASSTSGVAAPVFACTSTRATMSRPTCRWKASARKRIAAASIIRMPARRGSTCSTDFDAPDCAFSISRRNSDDDAVAGAGADESQFHDRDGRIIRRAAGEGSRAEQRLGDKLSARSSWRYGRLPDGDRSSGCAVARLSKNTGCGRSAAQCLNSSELIYVN